MLPQLLNWIAYLFLLFRQYLLLQITNTGKPFFGLHLDNYELCLLCGIHNLHRILIAWWSLAHTSHSAYAWMSGSNIANNLYTRNERERRRFKRGIILNSTPSANYVIVIKEYLINWLFRFSFTITGLWVCAVLIEQLWLQLMAPSLLIKHVSCNLCACACVIPSSAQCSNGTWIRGIVAPLYLACALTYGIMWPTAG